MKIPKSASINKLYGLACFIPLPLSACVNPVQAAGSPTATVSPIPSATTTSSPSPQPNPTDTPTITPQPHPVCTIAWAWRDGSLVITAVDFSRADGLAPGDLVTRIDGRSPDEVLAEIETGLGAIGDPELRRLVALETLLYENDSLVLTVRHGSQPAYYYVLFPDCRL